MKKKIQLYENKNSTVLNAYDHILFNIVEEQTLHGHRSFLFCGSFDFRLCGGFRSGLGSRFHSRLGFFIGCCVHVARVCRTTGYFLPAPGFGRVFLWSAGRNQYRIISCTYAMRKESVSQEKKHPPEHEHVPGVDNFAESCLPGLTDSGGRDRWRPRWHRCPPPCGRWR